MQRDLNYAYFARVQNGHAYANHNHQSELITNQIQHEDWRAFSVGAVWLFNKIACPLFQDLTRAYFLSINHTKKGHPTAAVTTPTGSSMAAMFLADRKSVV